MINKTTVYPIMQTRIFSTFFFSILATWLLAQEQPFARVPAISPDGQQVAFTYQGDIWTAPISGGQAIRLTIHEAYESQPIWSPDGQRIAFYSERYGNSDVFVIDANGNNLRRLTYHSTADLPSSWTVDNAILFETRRNFREVERSYEIHRIDATGGTPTRFMDAVGYMPAMSPNGRFIAFVRGGCRVVREAYVGPANKDVWLYDTQNKSYTQLTTFEGQDLMPKWSDNNTLFFLSARNDKTYNVFTLNLDGNGKATGEPAAISNLKEHGIRNFSVNTDGSTFAIERIDGIFAMDSKGVIRQIPLNVPSDYRFDPIENESLTRGLEGYDISPNGKMLAFTVRGEVFVKENDKEKRRSVQVTKHPYRDMSAKWLNDSTLLFLSDRAGNFDLFMARSSDKDQTNIYKSLKHEVVQITDTPEDEMNFYISPDASKIALVKGRGKLVTADINDGTLINETTLLDGWDTPSGIAWSPDSKWLAYSLDDLMFNSEIYIHAADNSKAPVNVSMHPKGDRSPFWSKDGSKLGFISARNFNDDDVWFVWLKEADWEKTQRDWEDDEEEATEEEENIVIDFENIHDRLVQVTSLPGGESSLSISDDGETFYFVAGRGGRVQNSGDVDLYSIKWDGSDKKSLTTGGTNPYGVSLSPDGKHLYYIKSGGLNSISTDGKKRESLGFTAKMKIDYVKEREQIIEEGWRTLDQGFYDPQFHGQDWADLKAAYKPWALKASTTQDFELVMNAMFGQVNASHMGFYGADREETQNHRTGLLGIEVVSVANGARVTKIVPNSPADRAASKLNIGDIITSINGETITNNTNIYGLLEGTANEKTMLEVNTGGANREVIIRPETSLSTERYEAWVKERQRLTEEYSGGKLGYIHIRGMNITSFERFERELMASGYGKEGVVIDVRFNGGGWTTDYLMAVLNVRQHAYTVPRGAAKNLKAENLQFKETYPFSERLPLSALTKPSIALCNHASYSNAEIFSHAYKHLDIGTLVGEPTFGAVISTGSRSLMGGHRVRLPFRAWYVKATEENMEHGPAVPDIIILNEPDSKAKGEDPQLKRAVEELLGELE